ncbi:hypothetical protein C0V75_06190 [Tabrizicola sp. TH137]|uniref:divergent polysaccharide deacetylase family protein n=1 Tax=Tabrizicola sp. TH137 TaxID=2067452 RepID=UPI000C7C8D34|nr:divergent polysaccharide deacetylase family protein [Tabrizicola sp. TH137]PLL13685.1 hypothetical protein C0V75_06190 [Tabrizicola sp. TH137]
MIRGFVTGVIWGGVVAAAGLAVMSQVAPLPQAAGDIPPDAAEAAPEAVAVPEVAEPEEKPEILQKGPEPAAEAEPGPEEAEAAPQDGSAAETDAPPAAEAQAVEPPVEIIAAAPTAPAATPSADAVPTPSTTAPSAPAQPETAAPSATVPEPTAEPSPAPLPAPPLVPMGEAAPAPAEAPPAAAPAPQEEALLSPAPEPEAELPPLMIVPDAPDGAEGQAQLPPEGTIQGNAEGVTTDRLPRIGDAPETAPEAEAEIAEQGTTPLELFARAFDNPEGKPLFALLLIDEGADPALRAELAELPFPVTFVLDPLKPETAAAARVYRDAGQEVAMLATGLPAGATAADMEQSFQALDLALPEAVAVVDAPLGGFQDDLVLARQAVPIVAAQGRGLVTYDRGLNPADQVARREGVPAAVIFRVLDSEGESVPKMRNYLDRAAFKAAQEGRVVVIGRARPETVAAILEWTVEGRGASVALAPVSAVLDRPANN